MRFLDLCVSSLSLSLILMSSTFAGDAKSKSQVKELDISVRDMAGIKSLRSVTGGVPIPQGAAPEGTDFILHNENNNPIPTQTSVLGRWKDGSVRWVLLDFQANPHANETSHFKLLWGKKVKAVNPKVSIKVERTALPVVERSSRSLVERTASLSVRSGNVELAPVENALLHVSNRFDVKLTLTDSKGQKSSGVVESADIETEGKIRSTLILKGAFRTPNGERVLGFRMRASVFAGLSKVFLEPHM